MFDVSSSNICSEFNVQRHYKTLNEKRYGQNQRNYFKQTGMLKSFAKCDSVAHQTASYDVALTRIFKT